MAAAAATADEDQTPSPQSPLSPPSSSSPSSLPPPRKTYELTACSIYYAKPAAPSLSGFLLARPCCRPAPPPDYILRDVSLTARPGELLAVVGPSGAGKSTLLDILSARTLPSHGLLLLNSLPLHPASFRKLSAHVPSSTPPSRSSPSPRPSPSPPPSSRPATNPPPRLTRAAPRLHRARAAPRPRGAPPRRAHLGLDSSSAHLVLQTLRAAAAARAAAVVLSIHQPSSRLLSSVDSLLLLSKGSVVHFGSLASLDAHLLSLGLSVPAQLNPLEYAMELLHQLPHPKPTTPSVSLPRKQEETKPASPSSPWETPAYSSSRAGEIGALYGRSWKVVYRTKQLLLTNFLEALLVGLLLGTLYINAGYGEDGARKRLGLFAFTLTFLLSATTETLPIFVCERPILIREASSGLYRLSSHVAAATLVFLPTSSPSPSSTPPPSTSSPASAPPRRVRHLRPHRLGRRSHRQLLRPLRELLRPRLHSGDLAGHGVPRGFFLFSGYFLTKESMPAYWVFMHYMSPYKYALDAMLANEGLRAEERWTGLQVLVGFFVLYRVLYWAVLSRRASMSKK
uniref:ABC transporter domain-containing protein n=1 Tax=Ananas comosus var. bracteatus TaxID=296719 RepID=A0A6V7QVZ9_ANACO